jgi:hypothetical protein
MSKEEQPRVHYRPKGSLPKAPEYRPLVEIEAGRLMAPVSAAVDVNVSNEPGLAHFRLDVELIDRRYQTVRLEATPPPGAGLDFEAVRRVRVPEMMRDGLASLIVYESVDGESYTAERPLDNPDPLWPVALTYSVAHALGQPPTLAVAERLRISAGAAAQRVKRARDAGYLPATTKGRAS